MTLIALHVLQNHAPSNLNRDDNGDPKDTLFGGKRRARISSQAIKRSIRWSELFRSSFADRPELLAYRTQLLPEQIRERIAGLELSDEIKNAIVLQAERLGKGDGAGDSEGVSKGKKGKKGEDDAEESRRKTAQLMFLTTREVDQLAEQFVALAQKLGLEGFLALDSTKMLKALGQYEAHAVDIAMFGRMTTSSPFKDVEAAVQVAPAISTHIVEQEFDFYTAVDDISGEAGAGFLGETSFNSATYYKYFNIHWEALINNLQGDKAIAQLAVQALIRAALLTNPSGKQNSFAAHNPPDVVLLEVRPRNIPISYANAFVKPVKATGDRSLVEVSADVLERYAATINRTYGLEIKQALLSTLDRSGAEGVEVVATLNDLLTWLQAQL